MVRRIAPGRGHMADERQTGDVARPARSAVPSLAVRPGRAWARGGLAALLGALVMSSLAHAQALDPRGKPPDTQAGAVEHYAVWRDKGGWHVRTTTKEYEHHFRGHIAVTGGKFEKVRGFKQERKGPLQDVFVVGPDERTINFDFATKGGIDGVDFRVKGKNATLSFVLEEGDTQPKFMPERVLVGKAGEHPAGSPFTLAAH